MKLSDATKILLGASEAAKACLGSAEVWSGGGTPWLEGWTYRKPVPLTAGGSIAGTVAVTNGSNTVVGTSTFFLQWSVGGQIQLPDSNWYTIATRADNTHLTISENYPGANASGQAYDMRLINYQMKLVIHRSAGEDSPGHVYIGTKCESDYDDIRFTTLDGQTLIDYWIESSDAASATTWIEFNSVGSDSTAGTFHMYYKNAAAPAVSNAANTFQFFDDFPGVVLDTDKWELVADPTIVVDNGLGLLTGGGNSDHYIKSKIFTALPGQSAVRTRIKANSTGTGAMVGFGFGNYYGGGGNTKCVCQAIYSTAGPFTYYLEANDGSGDGYNTYDAEDWAIHIKDILWGANNLVQMYKDGVQVCGDVVTKIPTDALFISLGAYYLSTGRSISVNGYWILVRQYLAIEPVWGAWGAEEAY